MLKKEWKSLLHNKLLLVVVVAVIVIPTIYTTLFLGSMWDPYGNLDKLPVAVVNKDQPVVYEGKKLQVGEELTDKLKEEESLCFNFVEDEVAEQGLKNGTYYMVITIPEDFSENAATLMDDKPKKMELRYETNPGTNYIASKMGETAMEKVKNSVAEEVTKTYTEAVFDQITEAGDGMQEAADGSVELKDGVSKLAKGNETISENLDLLAESSLTFRDGSETLQIGLEKYVDGVSSVGSGAGQLDEGAAELKSGVASAREGISALSDGTGQLADGSSVLKAGTEAFSSGLSELNGKIPALKEGIYALADGAGQLEAGSGSLSMGISNADTAMETLCAGLEQLEAGTSTLPEATGALQQGADQLNGGIKKLADSVSSRLVPGANALESGLHAVNGENGANSKGIADGAAQLNQGLTQLSTQLHSMAGDTQSVRQSTTETTGSVDASQARSAVSGLYEQADCLSSLAAGLNDGEAGPVSVTSVDGLSDALAAAVEAGDINQAAAIANQAIAAANANAGAAQDADNRLANAAAQTAQAKNALNQGSQAVRAAADRVNTGLNQITAKQTTVSETNSTTGVSQAQLAAVIQAVDQLKEGSGTLNTNVASYTAGVQQVTAKTPELTAAIQQVSDGLQGQILPGTEALADGTTRLHTQTPELVSGIQAASEGSRQFQTEAMTPLKEGAEQLHAGAKQFNQGTKTLKGNVPTLETGISQLDAGAKTLDTGAASLSQGIAQADAGAKQLLAGSNQLYDGTVQLKEGTGSLLSGTKELISNHDSLLQGTAKLSNGAEQISDGARQLRDGSLELGDGIEKVYDGTDTLASGLKNGAKQVKDAKTTDDTVEMFAAPVEARETQITTVENNGHAMAPYMMSVGLWVGCIAFSLMYPLTKYKGKLKSGISWWLSKASVLYTVAILQAIAMIGLLHVLDGFTPLETGKTLAFACLASVTFMSVMYFFTNTFGKVGSFLMLVFMVIQLAGSVGTYPLEISGSFVPYLHDWVPFTYTVEAFRSTIAGGESIQNAVIFLLIWFVIFNLLTVLVFQIRTRRIKSHKGTLDHWLEVHGLA